jgi:hypothetical protein
MWLLNETAAITVKTMVLLDSSLPFASTTFTSSAGTLQVMIGLPMQLLLSKLA